MAQGGCFCGNVRIEADVKSPAAKLICNCSDCRHISGSIFSTNLVIDEPKILQGQLKKYSSKAKSGRSMHTHFCGDCGTTVFRTGEKYPGKVILKVGVMDDQSVLDGAKPQLEGFAENKVSWMPELSGTELNKSTE